MLIMRLSEYDLELPYAGVATFFKFPMTKKLDDVDVAMFGVPLDLGTTNRSGCRLGPRAIRNASQIYGTQFKTGSGVYDVELGRNILSDTKIIDYGDVPIFPTSAERNMGKIEEVMDRILSKDVFPVSFGGDHSITTPLVSALNRKVDELDIIHLDTHLDFHKKSAGIELEFAHGSPIKHVSEMENVNHITQIGIRGLLNDQETFKESQAYGTNIITAHEALEKGMRWALKQIPKSKSDIYVTLDIDVLDPSTAPGTGTPEPGGLNYLQIKEILSGISEKGNIVGFDIVEVNPLYDVGDITAQIAARLAIDFLGYIFTK